jgi:nicotinamidase-related amidase
MKILVLVDLQNDFIDGTLGSKEAQAIVPNVINKLDDIDMKETLVIMTQDTHYDDYLDTLEGKYLPVKHCIIDTPGWEINKDIANAVDSKDRITIDYEKINNGRICKNTFGSDDLREFIMKYKDDIEEMEFIGLCTDICVVSNVLMARQSMPNTRIVVDASCCAGVTPEKHKAALETMRSCQIDVVNA